MHHQTTSQSIIKNVYFPLKLVHRDICGPLQSAAIGGSRYFVPLCDDVSALSLVYCIKTKAGASSAIKEMINGLENL